MIFLAVAGCASLVPMSPPGLTVLTISPDQIVRLSQLQPGVATRQDVIAILGEPSYQSVPPTPQEVRSALDIDGLRTAPPPVRPQGPSAGQSILTYNTAPYRIGGAVEFLMVFLQADRFVGYLFEGRMQADPSADPLAAARPMVVGPATRQQLLDRLGSPVQAALADDGLTRLVFALDSPAELAGTGIDRLRLGWRVDNAGSARFEGLTPQFIWRHEDPQSLAAGQAHIAAAARDHIDHIQRGGQAGMLITAGPQYDHVRGILGRLMLATPRPLGAVALCLVQDDQPNAFASLGPDGPIVGVHTGLLKLLGDDDELAAVLAHELGHLVERHASVPAKFLVNWLRQRGLEPMRAMFRWIQTNEYTADMRGVEIAEGAGFDPAAAQRTLAKLEAVAEPLPPELLAEAEHPAAPLRRRLLGWYLDYRARP